MSPRASPVYESTVVCPAPHRYPRQLALLQLAEASWDSGGDVAYLPLHSFLNHLSTFNIIHGLFRDGGRLIVMSSTISGSCCGGDGGDDSSSGACGGDAGVLQFSRLRGSPLSAVLLYFCLVVVLLNWSWGDMATGVRPFLLK